MAKAKVKLDFILLAVPLKIQYGRDRVDDMTGNANFPTPDVPLVDITAACLDLETKYNLAQGGGPADTAAQDAAELVWDDLMRKEAGYVDRIADGDVVIITSAGFSPTETILTPSLPPAKPENLKLTHGDQPGKILTSCDRIENAKGFVTIITSDPNATVTLVGEDAHIRVTTGEVIIHSSTSRKSAHGMLSSATRYNVRKYAFNTAGRSSDSEVSSIVAP